MFVQETVCSRISDIEFAIIDYCKTKKWPYVVVKPQTRDDVGDSKMGEEKWFSYNGFWEEPGVAFRTGRW